MTENLGSPHTIHSNTDHVRGAFCLRAEAGAAELGVDVHTNLMVFDARAVAGFIALAAAWLLVATKTFIGSVIQGALSLNVAPNPAA